MGDLVFLALGTAVTAFAIWLTVRVINRHERWAKWTAVGLVVLPVLYVVSFGPTCWMLDRGWIGYETPIAVYRPLRIIIWHLPRPASDAIEWWGNVGSDLKLASFVLLFDIEPEYLGNQLE